MKEPTESSKQPIRAGHLGHVTGYQPISDQYFLVRSVPGGCSGSEVLENQQAKQDIMQTRVRKG